MAIIVIRRLCSQNRKGFRNIIFSDTQTIQSFIDCGSNCSCFIVAVVTVVNNKIVIDHKDSWLTTLSHYNSIYLWCCCFSGVLFIYLMFFTLLSVSGDPEIFTKFMKAHKSYDLIPTSAKLIVFDTQLSVSSILSVISVTGIWGYNKCQKAVQSNQ